MPATDDRNEAMGIKATLWQKPGMTRLSAETHRENFHRYLACGGDARTISGAAHTCGAI